MQHLEVQQATYDKEDKCLSARMLEKGDAKTGSSVTSLSCHASSLSMTEVS